MPQNSEDLRVQQNRIMKISDLMYDVFIRVLHIL